MIRQIRLVIVILFALSVIFGAGTRVYHNMTTDTTAPVITMESDSIDISIEDSTDAILDGITAIDAEDGDVTSGLTIESISNFIEEGTREATIAAFDDAGNVSKTRRTVHYTDYTSPKLSLSGTLCASTTDYSSLLDLVKVTDCLDGDISGDIQMTSDNVSSLTNAGDYKMHIQVTNSAGDSLNIPVTVTIYENQGLYTRAEFTLSKYVVYVNKGKKVHPEKYLKELTFGSKDYIWDDEEQALVDTELTTTASGYTYYDKLRLGDWTVDSNVDTDTEGTYEITYRYNSDNVSGLARLLVIVGGGQ